MDTQVPISGRRAANKLDKLTRIKRAAHDLFIQHGFDETTTRQIAARAEVALGTVFTYATNKRDLLFLVANDILDGMHEDSLATVRPEDTLLTNFVRYCSVNYMALGGEPAFSRLIMRELQFYDSGVQAVRAVNNRAQIVRDYEAMIMNAVNNGEVQRPARTEDFARVMFGVQQAEIRRWLTGEEQDLLIGVGWLWTSASYLIKGIALGEVPQKITPAQLRRLLRPVKSRTGLSIPGLQK